MRTSICFSPEPRSATQVQSRFHKNYSTETALIRLMNQLLFNLDKNRVFGLVFIDYKKTFGLIDHSLLFGKLNAYGIRGKELNRLKDYLSNRLQYVNIAGHCSPLESVNVGVPQGSILGPVLFLLL